MSAPLVARRDGSRRPSVLLAATIAALILLAGIGLAHAQGMPPGGAGRGPTEVGVMALEEADVPYAVTLPGRAVASAQTEIRPRVGGMVEEILYQPGRPVDAGTPLFRLEPDSYEAALAAAEASQASAEAALATAKATVERYERLEGVGATVSEVQTARSNVASAEATLKSAEAAVQTAQLDLDRSVLKSPIAGIVDVAAVSVGAIVTANQTDALTTVTQLDPIYVDVSESAARIIRVRERIDSGAMQPGDRMEAELTLESGSTYAGIGRLVTPGTSVSTTTGAVDVRFEFDNGERKILPGQFLRVKIVIGTQRAVLVPQRATTRQSDGTLTAFLAVDGKAQRVVLETSGTHENAWVVTSGVAAGDMVILDGLTTLADGAAISPVPVTIAANGVVQDAAPADAAEARSTAAPAAEAAAGGN
ncbi:efflux RND transporter periplasmic adaptor subunit [Vannielia litorea]|uniref:Membrane fusion protein, multidrug efflux system n=1 Tax=Vannielia litorea TaxID=1217970 RepID=A0A1N6GJU1_9RHOB|nr:efflux RND transporter periplasmic adaptor subunit [Vannielia litorea]SIO07774.1 membrane fusion protein, multidrug efflux system [Vannielia litorea]